MISLCVMVLVLPGQMCSRASTVRRQGQGQGGEGRRAVRQGRGTVLGAAGARPGAEWAGGEAHGGKDWVQELAAASDVEGNGALEEGVAPCAEPAPGGGQLLERGCLLLWGRLLLRELVLLGGIVVWGQEGDHLLGWRVRKEVLWGSGWGGGCIPRGMTWLPDRGREEGGYSSSSDLRPGGWAGSPSRLCGRGCSDVGGNLGGLGGQGRRGVMRGG